MSSVQFIRFINGTEYSGVEDVKELGSFITFYFCDDYYIVPISSILYMRG
jgi:hypothetical protein